MALFEVFVCTGDKILFIIPMKMIAIMKQKQFTVHTLLILACLIGLAKRAPHWGVQSRFHVIYMCRYVCRVLKCVGGLTYAHAQSQFWAVKTDLQHPCYLFRLYARAALAWTKRTFT